MLKTGPSNTTAENDMTYRFAAAEPNVSAVVRLLVSVAGVVAVVCGPHVP